MDPPNKQTTSFITDEEKKRREGKKEDRSAKRAGLKKQKQKQSARVVPVMTAAAPSDDDDDEPPPSHSSQLPLPTLAPAPRVNPNPNPRQRRPFVWVKDWEWKEAHRVSVCFWREWVSRLIREGLPLDEYGSLALPYKALDQFTHMPVEVRRRRRLRSGEVVLQDDRVMWLEMAEGEVDGAPILDTSGMTEKEDLAAELHEKFRELGLR